MLYGGRIVGGVGIGVLSTVVPVFIAESSPAKLRGTFTAVFQLMITFGILVASSVNSAIIKALNDLEAEWRVAFGCQIVPGMDADIVTQFKHLVLTEEITKQVYS